LLKGNLTPVRGREEDTAHPAIYPTGVKPKPLLGGMEAKLYDLIVRRFLSVLAPSARRELASVLISVGSRHHFKLAGERTLNEGWMHYYRRYLGLRDVQIPVLTEGDRLKVVAIEHDEKFERPPPRYNQGSLLDKMEQERLGTKATRAEIISTLVARGYVSEDNLAASDLGFAVMEVMRRYAPSVVTTDLTREVEQRLERIEAGTESSKGLIQDTIETISSQLISLNENEGDIGYDLNLAVNSTLATQDVLGACPACQTGKLRIIRSRKTHKRFVGCTNYSNGCRASAPLPQKGAIKNTGSVCATCSWPMVYVGMRRFRWKLCINPECPSRDKKRRARTHEV
jgi:DNA topoisomerase-1